MEKTYTLTKTITEEINTLINEFYVEIDKDAGKLVFLEIIDGLTTMRQNFLKEFMATHQELRNGSTNKIRHFILMKSTKISKNLENKLPLLDIINTFPTEIEHNYWNMVHLLYIMLESATEDKKDEIINTLGVEIHKRAEQREHEENDRVAKIEHDKQVAEQRLINREHREAELPDMSEMMKHMDNNPEIMEMLAQMTGTDMTSNTINDTLKRAMGDNPEMTSMFTNALSQMKDTNSVENLDIMGMITQFMPDLDMSCETNVVLVNKIYKDIVFIFSTDDDANSTVKDRVTSKIAIYQDLITNGRVTPSEMAACLMRISTNEAMKQYITDMEKAEVSMDLVIEFAIQFLPTEITSKFGDIETIKKLMAEIGTGDISKIIAMFSGAAPTVEEVALTEEQEQELEKYYDEHFFNVKK